MQVLPNKSNLLVEKVSQNQNLLKHITNMIDLGHTSVKVLNKIFRSYNNRGIEYVFLRRFDGYPDYIPGDGGKILDIDLLVHQTDYDAAVDISKKHGFEPSARTRMDISSLVKQGISKPSKAIQHVLTKPIDSLSRVQTSATNSFAEIDSHYDWACNNNYAFTLEYYDQSVSNGSVMLDLKCHLAHESPMNNDRYRLDPKVENHLFDNKIERNYLFFVPARADELAHIVSHAVFEYDGTFTNYYINRCEQLKSEMSNSEWSRLEEILELIYFKASPTVLNHIKDSDFDSLLQNLLSFHKY